MQKHRLDPLSLVFGAIFAALGGLFLFARTDVADLHLKWIWPLPLIVLGALIIALSVREGRPAREPAEPAGSLDRTELLDDRDRDDDRN